MVKTVNYETLQKAKKVLRQEGFENIVPQMKVEKDGKENFYIETRYGHGDGVNPVFLTERRNDGDTLTSLLSAQVKKIVSLSEEIGCDLFFDIYAFTFT